MRKIIVDTNIIFSCLLHSQGNIGDLIFNSDNIFEFFSNEYMRFEIRKHWGKLKKISGLSDGQLQASLDILLTKVIFIREDLIPEKTWKKAELLAKGIDLDDTDFIALTIYLKGSLWTGDKQLYEGLKVKHFRTAYNTFDMIDLRNELSAT